MVGLNWGNNENVEYSKHSDIFSSKTSHAHLHDQNLNLLMFDNYSKSKITWHGYYYLTLWNLSESFHYSKFSLLPQFNPTMNEIPKFVQ